ncbi:MAG TPA: hypothetical protein VEZ16_04580 [Microvirga sp.]|nr:hypothetical protein [Microvirga sp.]
MRDLSMEELGHVYGAGKKAPCKKYKHKKGSKSRSKSKSKSRSKSRGKKHY